MDLLSAEVVIAELWKIDGLVSVELDGNRVLIRMADRDWFPVRRRAAAWVARCSSRLDFRYELIATKPSGAYDPLERAISRKDYRPRNAKEFPPE